MYLKKFAMHIIIGIIFVGTGFLFGYFLGKIFYTPAPEPTKEISLSQEIAAEPIASPDSFVSAPPSQAPENTAENTFLVQSSGNSIYIYELSDSSKTPVKAFDVNIDIFPSADRELLSEGIEVYGLQDAYEIVENFTS